MAGIVLLGAGWAAWSLGAGAGSIAYACLPDDSFRRALTVPHSTWCVVIGGLVILNHLRAHVYTSRQRARGTKDISAFAMEMYTENLILLGYGFAILTANYLSCRRERNRPPELFSSVQGGGEHGGIMIDHQAIPALTSSLLSDRGWCGLYAALISILPLPIAWPVAFFLHCAHFIVKEMTSMALPFVVAGLFVVLTISNVKKQPFCRTMKIVQ